MTRTADAGPPEWACAAMSVIIAAVLVVFAVALAPNEYVPGWLAALLVVCAAGAAATVLVAAVGAVVTVLSRAVAALRRGNTP